MHVYIIYSMYCYVFTVFIQIEAWASISFVTFLTQSLFKARSLFLQCLCVRRGAFINRLLSNMASSQGFSHNVLKYIYVAQLDCLFGCTILGFSSCQHRSLLQWLPRLLFHAVHNLELECNVVAFSLGHRGNCHGCRH